MATYFVDGAVGNDSNPGTSAGAGNAFATLGKAAATATAAGDLVNVKASATYTITASVVWASSGATAGPITIRGYTSSPGDGGRASVACATSSVDIFQTNGSYQEYENFTLTHTGSTRGAGFSPHGGNRSITIKNCLMDGCFRGIDGDNSVNYAYDGLTVVGCEIKNSISDAISSGNGLTAEGCSIHNNGGDGWRAGGTNPTRPIVFVSCTFYSNAIHVHQNRATSDAASILTMVNCTLHGATSDGLKDEATMGTPLLLYNNIFTSNGGYGVNILRSMTARTLPGCDYNWFGTGSLANTSGARSSNLSAGPHDLSGDPGYTSAGTGNFTPTNAAVQAGYP